MQRIINIDSNQYCDVMHTSFTRVLNDGRILMLSCVPYEAQAGRLHYQILVVIHSKYNLGFHMRI